MADAEDPLVEINQILADPSRRRGDKAFLRALIAHALAHALDQFHAALSYRDWKVLQEREAEFPDFPPKPVLARGIASVPTPGDEDDYAD